MKKYLESLTSFLRIFRYGDQLKPVRDWLVLLGITSLLLILSVVWNIWLFVNSENIKAINTATLLDQSTASGSIPPVQAVFQERATQETDYQHTYQFVDPSLPNS